LSFAPSSALVFKQHQRFGGTAMLNFSRRTVLALAAGAALTIGAPLIAQTGIAFPFKFSGFTGQQLRAPAIAVPSYQVTFFTAHQSTAVSDVAVRARLTATLAGVDEARMRALTEEAYADLKAQLAAAGIDLLPADKVKAAITAGGSRLAPGNAEIKGIGGGITIGKSVRKVYAAFGAADAPLIEGLHSPTPMGAGGILKSFGASSNLNAATKSLNAVLIMPSLVIDFADSDAKTGRDFLGRKRAMTSSDIGFTVAGTSRVSLSTAMSGGRFVTPGMMALSKDYRSDRPFATVATGEGAVKALSVARVTDSNYTIHDTARGDVVNIDPAAWEPLVREAYRAFNASIVAEVKKAQK
jgi:hypothetical protein